MLLTSHYMADVEALCKRVIVIHHGRILFDGQLDALAQRFATHKTIEAVLADGERVSLRVPRAETSLGDRAGCSPSTTSPTSRSRIRRSRT